ncbi:MAG: alpha/beta hydrolase [Chitinophagales bacterium]|nr:alpha/beta hydrolase [Chitinophagales bacterium]
MQPYLFSILISTFLWQGNSSNKDSFPNQKFSVDDYQYTVLNDIEYANVDGQSIKLDLYQPTGLNQPSPVLLWIHGGAYTGGDKANAHKYAWMFAEKGIAVASVNYRLAPGAVYPSQVNDVKGAIRFLRANAAKYNLDANHIGILGTSAGGSIACQVGVTCGEKDLEGTTGGNLNYSSCVQAVVDCFGSFSYENMKQTGFSKSRENHIEMLLGCDDVNSPECWEKIKKIAPENHLDKNDPPFFILHGEQDHSVPVQNSIDFNKKLLAAGIPSTLITDPDYDHDVRLVVKYFDEVMKFLNQYLR